jgi:pantothenate synthetase
MFIKIFEPKEYIWSVEASGYLQSHTSLVSEAHKIGMQVLVSDFANDKLSSFNYNHDPLAEYSNSLIEVLFSITTILF